MIIYLNGEKKELNHNSLIKLITEQNIKTKGIAIGINEEIIPKNSWEKTLLKNNDRIEIIKAFAGG